MNQIFNYVLPVLALGLIFLMFRNSRRNKARQAELLTQMVPGAEVMTNFGLYGTLVSVDELANIAVIEISPGNTVRVHRQTLSKVVTADDTTDVSSSGDAPRSVEEAMEIANREAAAREEQARKEIEAQGEPQFGERIDTTPAPEAKPVRRTRTVKKDVTGD